MATRKKICKNCEKWEDGNSFNGVHGTCSDPNFVYTGDTLSKRPEKELHYWDSEGWSAGFTTGPEFGCIYFKKRGGERR